MKVEIQLKNLFFVFIVSTLFSNIGLGQSSEQLDTLNKNSNIALHIKVSSFGGSINDVGTKQLWLTFDVHEIIKYDTLKLISLALNGFDERLSRSKFGHLDSTKNVLFKPEIFTPTSCSYVEGDIEVHIEVGKEYIVFLNTSSIQLVGTDHAIDDSVIVSIAYGNMFVLGNSLEILNSGIFPYSKKLSHELSNI